MEIRDLPSVVRKRRLEIDTSDQEKTVIEAKKLLVAHKLNKFRNTRLTSQRKVSPQDRHFLQEFFVKKVDKNAVFPGIIINSSQ